MFSNINKLKKGDIVKITSNSGYQVEYVVVKKKVILPSDTSCLKQQDEYKQLTLITCVNGVKNRLVVICREKSI